MDHRIILWFMMAVQMLGWSWHQWKAGELSDKHYVIFCAMMLCGQLGAGIECFVGKAWGTLVVQAYFFVWTAFGAVKRYKLAKNLV